MVNRMQFYIDGAWVDPVVKKSTPVVNPATEEAMYEVALGSKADVDKAVAAAKRAFETYSQTSREERVALLSKIIEVYKTRMKDIGAAVSDEMGAPLPMAEKLQAGAGLGHLASTLEVLKNYHFEEPCGSAVVLREPVGVIGSQNSRVCRDNLRFLPNAQALTSRNHHCARECRHADRARTP